MIVDEVSVELSLLSGCDSWKKASEQLIDDIMVSIVQGINPSD